MAIEYVVIKRKVSVGSNPGIKYFADIKRGQMVEFDEICQELANKSAVSKGVVKNVFENIPEVLPKYLKNGRTVNLGPLGLLRTYLLSKAQEHVEDVEKDDTKRPVVRFFLSKELKWALSKVSIIKGSLDKKGYQSGK